MANRAMGLSVLVNWSTPTPGRSIESAIRRQPLQAAFPAETAFLVAAKRAGRIKLVVRVRPDDAGTEFVDQFEDLAAFVGPHPGTQAVGNIVCAFEGFLGCAEGHHTQHRAEDLFLSDAVRVG